MKVKEKAKVNRLCEHCYNSCKQDESVKLVNCPNYIYKPYQLSFDFWKDKPERKRKNK